MKGTNLRTKPKHIVFLSQLLLLFKFCHVCKADNPMVEAGGIGTQAAIKSTCGNPACRKEQTWYSQPLIPGTQMPAGNFLLCLSILLVGGSATKIFQRFSHMGLGCISLNTFFKCQRVSEDVSISSIYLAIHQLHILCDLISCQLYTFMFILIWITWFDLFYSICTHFLKKILNIICEVTIQMYTLWLVKKLEPLIHWKNKFVKCIN